MTLIRVNTTAFEQPPNFTNNASDYNNRLEKKEFIGVQASVL